MTSLIKALLALSLAEALKAVTSEQTDKEKRTTADVQSRQDKNAAKRARRAARYAK